MSCWRHGTWSPAEAESGWQRLSCTQKGMNLPIGTAVGRFRENLLHTIYKGDDHLLLEEPVGVPPEIFMEERGHSSMACIVPTKGETLAHLSPSNAYGGFSSLNGRFIDAALEERAMGRSVPLMIWVLRLDVIRDNAEFHQSFHSLAVYSACLTNWFLRLSRLRDPERDKDRWNIITNYCAFAVYGFRSRSWMQRGKQLNPPQNDLTKTSWN